MQSRSERNEVKPPTRQVQSVERDGFPISVHRRTRLGLHDNSVVVLGVMYPSVDQNPLLGPTKEFAASSSELASDQQNMDVLFYDPLSCNGIDDPIPLGSLPPAGGPKPCRQRMELQNRGTANRVIELEAVARELALLSLRKKL